MGFRNKALVVAPMLIMAIMLLLLTACTRGVSKEDYDSMVWQRDYQRTQAASLQNDLNAANEKVTSLENELAAAEGQIAAFKEGTAVPELEQKVASLENELSTAQQTVASLQNDLGAANEKMASLENELGAAEDKASALERRIATSAKLADFLAWHVTPQEETDLTKVVEEWQTWLQDIDDQELSAIVEEMKTLIDTYLAQGLLQEEVAASAEYREVHQRISNYLIQKRAEVLRAE